MTIRNVNPVRKLYQIMTTIKGKKTTNRLHAV